MRNARKSKGFTLIELLIVITVIGILSGSVMLTMGSSADKAEATRIVTDLHSLKLAAGQDYADNVGGTLPPGIARRQAYVTAPQKLDDDKYEFVAGADAGQWFVGYKVAGADAGVRENLKKMAAANGLRVGTTSADTDVYDGGTAGIYVRVK